MPANLPPQYYEAEKRLRETSDPAEKIEIMEELLAIMPKHKGTDHLKAELRAKIAKLTLLMGKKTSVHRTKMTIPKEGAGQMAIIGLPNSGKSQLVCSVTSACPAVADYPFTTQTATPGMMQFENIQIQLIDTPPLTPQSTDFLFSNMLRRADALLIMVDLADDPVAQTESLLDILGKMRISTGRPKAEEEEGAIITYKKAIIVANKVELDVDGRKFTALQSKYANELPVIAISAQKGTGLEEMKLKIYQLLEIIRVYTKMPGGKPDFHDPIVLEKGRTLEDAAASVHKDFLARLKYARIWGSGKHDGVMVKRDHVLQDGDIIELHV